MLAATLRTHNRLEPDGRGFKTLSAVHFGGHMLYYAAVFLVIALIAALFGFGGIAAGAAGIAKILFFVFLVIAAVTFLMSVIRRA
jgi:uncharacterized membrane protein YtjA (UPF0391 family)